MKYFFQIKTPNTDWENTPRIIDYFYNDEDLNLHVCLLAIENNTEIRYYSELFSNGQYLHETQAFRRIHALGQKKIETLTRLINNTGNDQGHRIHKYKDQIKRIESAIKIARPLSI